MDEIFRALADRSRRRLLDSLNVRDGQSLRELCVGLDMTRQSVSKHLAILISAGLIDTRWNGREKSHFLNAAPISAVGDRWISRYARDRVRALDDLKTALEQRPMSDTEFRYTTFINTTPERLWQALTDPAFTRRYWGVAFESDWTTGASMSWEEGGVRITDPEQVIIEAEPFRRLTYTWHTFTPQWAAAHGFDDDLLGRLAGEARSRVTFDIEPAGPVVKLTVVHGDFPPGSTVRDMVQQGWPQLLSSLKTLLETGEALPPAA